MSKLPQYRPDSSESPPLPPTDNEISKVQDAPSTAARYADIGLAPIRIYGLNPDGTCQCGKPSCPPKSAGKHPVNGGWQNETIDAAACDAWIAKGGNVGLRMGVQPDEDFALVALDEDEPGALAKVEAKIGALPPTLTARSGGGGQHRIFTWPENRALPKNAVKAIDGLKIDVRSQGGQIVVEPSLHRTGNRYEWEPEPGAFAEMPAAWCDALSAGAPTKAKGAKGVASVLAKAEAAAMRLPAAVEGHDGSGTCFHAACEIAKITKDEAMTLDVLVRVYGPRCLPPWTDREELKHKAEDAHATIAKGAAWRASVSGAAHSKAPAGEAPATDDGFRAASPKDDTPILLSAANNQMYVWSPSEGTYRGPYGYKRMRVICLHLGADMSIRKKDGEWMGYDGIYDSGAHVETIVRAFSDTRTYYDPEREALHHGYILPAVEPREDPSVAAWLEALCGPMLPNVLQWIASCSQAHIDRKAAALVFVGPPNVGKTLTFRALARLWGARSFVPLADSIAQFNGTITRSPIVLDDECAAIKARKVTSAEFRQRVQATERDYEPKGKEKVELIGCTREGITANDQSEITFADVRGRGVVEALQDRLLVVQCADVVGARAALAAVRGPTNDVDAEMARVMGHLRWIWETVPVPEDAGRFIGAGGTAAQAVALASVVADGTEIWERFAAWIDAWAANPDVDQNVAPALRCWYFEDGRFWANAHAINRAMGPEWNARKVSALIQAIAFGPRERRRFWPRKDKDDKDTPLVSVWPLDMALVDRVLP